MTTETHASTPGELLLVQKLSVVCNPFHFTCWKELNSPILMREVWSSIVVRNLIHPDCVEFFDRQTHINRIAWFVVHGWSEPIDIDVGVPSLGCYVRWPICDGNHRFAAAIVRGDQWILANVSGAVSEIAKYKVVK